MSETVYKGDDWEIPFQYTQDGDPYDITSITEIKACLAAQDGGAAIEVTLTGGEITVDSALAGKGTINVPKAKSALVKKGNLDLIVIRTDNTSKERTNKLLKYLIVEDRGC